MYNAQVRPTAKVLTLDDDQFDVACKQLMDLVLRDWRPTVLIGIRSGGLYVAEAMASTCSTPIPILSITCRRPTTRLKTASSALHNLIADLPRPILDNLRVLEHRFITQRTKAPRPGARQIDAAELEVLDCWLANAGPAPSILIVDDSVDSGVTLAIVHDTVRRRAPLGAVIRTATITLTTRKPAVFPDYILFHQKLCRFPWSLDAQHSLQR